MSHIDAYNRVSPVECYKLQIIGVYCILVFVLSIFFNSVLLWVFHQNKKLRNSHNTFTIFLTFLNLFGSILQFIFVIPSNFNCRYITFHLNFACLTLKNIQFLNLKMDVWKDWLLFQWFRYVSSRLFAYLFDDCDFDREV